MRDLIVKLEVVDDDTASVLRVIEHFDRLAEDRASAAAVVRAAAAMAGCVAGLHDAARGTSRRYAASGRPLSAEEATGWSSLAVPGQPGSCVWLERQGAPGPLDALILERAGRSLPAPGGSATYGSAEALVRIVCDDGTSDSDRRRAAEQLGLTEPVSVIVGSAVIPDLRWRAEIDGRRIALATDVPPWPDGLRAGFAVAGQLADLPAALADALIAFRVADRPAGVGSSIVDADGLGALREVAHRFTPREAAAVQDVRRLDELHEHHPWLVDTIQAVLDHSSLRRAAAVLHVHHSTLQERMTWVDAHVGYAMSGPAGRPRAALSLLLWRLAHSDDAEHAS